ncbi:hypothetical protein Fot_41768 [Forsythia ovata]|uniref:Uncharacterized protein n=1 Tax=Forsythia ovata TaxID=205694 RepID=A0ABD1RJY5_9LAMI
MVISFMLIACGTWASNFVDIMWRLWYTLRIAGLRWFANDSQYLRAKLEFWRSPPRNRPSHIRSSGDRAITRRMIQDVFACLAGLSPFVCSREVGVGSVIMH